MLVIHQAEPDSIQTIMKHGLKPNSPGGKGEDESIENTDQFLDGRIPSSLSKTGLTRNDAIYAYYCHEDTVIDITDGKAIARNDFIDQSDPILLQLSIDPRRAYVSDLDKYDLLKSEIINKESPRVLDNLANEYWRSVQRLDKYIPGRISRPEILITYNIPPQDIDRLK